MKEKIIEFFQNQLPSSKTEQFNKLFELYRQSPGKSIASERIYNASGYSPQNLKSLIYDLQQLYGIRDAELVPKPKAKVIAELSLSEKILKLFSDLEVSFEDKELIESVSEDQFIEHIVTSYKNKKVEPLSVIEKAKLECPEIVELFEKAYNIYLTRLTTADKLGIMIYGDIQDAEITSVLGISDEELTLSVARLFAIEGFQHNAIIDKAKAEFPDTVELLEKALELSNKGKENAPLAPIDHSLVNQTEVTHEIPKTSQAPASEEQIELYKTEAEHNGKLREEFPFLNDKDCPDVAHILVGRKVAAWKRYQMNHEKLQQFKEGTLKLTKAEAAELARESVEDFAENQAIYEELNSYKEIKEFLKKLPLFRTLRLKEEVENMTSDQLIKFKNSSVKYFSDNNKQLKVAGITEKKALEINSRIEERKEKLALVNEKLGIAK